MLKQTILLASLALFAFPACGDTKSFPPAGNPDAKPSTGGTPDAMAAASDGGIGQSGIEGNVDINDLSGNQVTDFCTWSIDEQGGENIETDCGGGITANSGTQQDCETLFASFPECDLTVAQLEECTAARAADACAGLEDATCFDFFECQAGV